MFIVAARKPALFRYVMSRRKNGTARLHLRVPRTNLPLPGTRAEPNSSLTGGTEKVLPAQNSSTMVEQYHVLDSGVRRSDEE